MLISKDSLVTKCKGILLFAVAFSLTIVAGMFVMATGNERTQFRINLGSGQSPPALTVDLANQGLPKRLFQPNTLLVLSGHSGGIINGGVAPILLKVETKGFESSVHFESIDECFNNQTGIFEQPLSPKSAYQLDIILSVPNTALKKAQVSGGTIVFTDLNTNTVLDEMPISVVNTRR